MKLPLNVGLVDLAVLTVLFVMAVLPPRPMYASAAAKGFDDHAQFAFALGEARTIADPKDGELLADFARRLGEANYKDWAIDASVGGAKRATGAPTEWKALLAASVAYVDKLDIQAALDYGTRALEVCRGLPTGCPSWEEVRMAIYREHLDAGIKSGIDPKIDPKGFRAASENAIRSIRLNTQERENPRTPAPSPAP